MSDIYAFYEDTYKGSLGQVQVECLDYLHRMKAASTSELAEQLNNTKQHASKILSSLESLGYAAKKTNPSDGRMSICYLTKTGQDFIEKHISRSNDHLIARLHGLDEQERAAFLDTLMRLAELLEHI